MQRCRSVAPMQKGVTRSIHCLLSSSGAMHTAHPSALLVQLRSQEETLPLPRLSLPAAGIREAQLPGPGEVADFDELVALLASVGARARLVTDPLPFLTTTTPPLGRWGGGAWAHAHGRHRRHCSVCWWLLWL